MNSPTSPTASAPAAAAPDPRQVALQAVPPAPSVHVRAVITWTAIFPLVAVGMMVVAPLTEGWHPVLRALVLTLVVLPRLFAGYGSLLRRRNSRRAGE